MQKYTCEPPRTYKARYDPRCDRRKYARLTCEANLEKLGPLTPEIESHDAAAVSEVALYLMQKVAGPGIRDSDKWHPFLRFIAHAVNASGVAQLRKVSTAHAPTRIELTPKDQILADMHPGHERSVVALYYTAEVASWKLYKIAEDPSKSLD